MPEIVGAYARLSKLRGRTENIDTQHQLGTDAAHARWPGCEVCLYADPDASGEREDVVRPDFDRLRADIANGTLTQLVAGDQERFTRRPEVLEDFITLLRRARIDGFLGYRDGWTSVVEGQSAGARYKGVGAKEYVEGIKVKTNERLDALAEKGRPGPGTAFGYRHVRGLDAEGRPRSRFEVVADEAAAIRWAADAVLSGWTLNAVAAELDRRGLPCRRGAKRWSPATVGQVLTRSAAIAGKRTHRGVIVGDGDWEAILDELTWRRLQALFDARRRTRPARRYTLTGGLAVCGECDLALVGMTQSRKGGPRWAVYQCRSKAPDGTVAGCGRVTASAVSLEAHVADVLGRYLRSEGFAARVAAKDPAAPERRRLVDALAGVDARRRTLARRWARNERTDAEWDEARAELADESARYNAALAALPPPSPVVDPDAVVADWDAMVLGEQREVLRMALSRVVVDRASRRGPVFDTSRVRVFDLDGVELT